MSASPRLLRHALGAAAIAVVLPACDRTEPLESVVDENDDPVFVVADRAESPEIRHWLRVLGKDTKRFRSFAAAQKAGYTAQITECMHQPGAGGMGFHYGDPALIDARVQPYRPEVLLYEPLKNGELRFVAVEYIVPFDAWTAADPPELNGLTFRPNQTFQVWALHVWIARHNPSGRFADWNPVVNCEHAS